MMNWRLVGEVFVPCSWNGQGYYIIFFTIIGSHLSFISGHFFYMCVIVPFCNAEMPQQALVWIWYMNSSSVIVWNNYKCCLNIRTYSTQETSIKGNSSVKVIYVKTVIKISYDFACAFTDTCAFTAITVLFTATLCFYSHYCLEKKMLS